MNAMRNLLVLVVVAGVALAAGCEKKYTIKVSNVTSEVQKVEFKERGVFTEASMNVQPDGGTDSCVIEQEEGDTVAFTIKTNKYSKDFTISKNSPSPMYFHITPNGIIGPVDKDTKVKEQWDTKKTGKVYEGEKVE
jgi:hypothetical protein